MMWNPPRVLDWFGFDITQFQNYTNIWDSEIIDADENENWKWLMIMTKIIH